MFGKKTFRGSAAGNSTRAIGLRTAVSIFLIFIVILSVFAVTLVTFLQARRVARDEIRARLLTAAGTAALFVDAESHARVRFEPQSSRKEFRDLQRKLLLLQRKIPDARYVYTFRLNDKNQMAFVGDSDDSESKSHRGEVYLQETPAMRAAFARGAVPVAEAEFGSDRWGTWLSGYAPLLRADGSVEAIIGVDISANQVRQLEKRYLYVGIFSSLLIIAILLPFLLYATHTITQPLFNMAAQLKRMRDFDLNSSQAEATRIREINDLNSALEATRVGLRSFKKYIPVDLASQVVTSREEAKIGASKREITLMFTDFEGFTTSGEMLTPDELMMLLNLYFETISRAIDEFHGTVDKFIGDSVMAFWNAPSEVANHQQQACRAAIMICDRIRAINSQRAAQGLIGLKIRIGIHTGMAMVGNIGHDRRLSYTAIGDAVNMASRIEQLNKVHGTQILVSSATMERLDSSFQTRHIEDVVLKGRSQPISVFELLGELRRSRG